MYGIRSANNLLHIAYYRILSVDVPDSVEVSTVFDKLVVGLVIPSELGELSVDTVVVKQFSSSS